MRSHPTAVVHPKAHIADDVVIGPYSVIDEHVEIGSGTRIANHVTITGFTSIGHNNDIAPSAVIGTIPQDMKFRGETSYVRIGDDNDIREFVTIHRGTALGGGETRMGHRNLVMAYCHVAHDCLLDDDIVLANNTVLAGHVKIESFARVGGMVAIHHFVAIGRHAFVGGFSRISRDVPPFMIVEGNPARVRGLNLVGLKRAHFDDARINAIKDAHRIIFRQEPVQEKAFQRIRENGSLTEDVAYLIGFLQKTASGKMGRAREALRQDLPGTRGEE
ncbi:MAG: acyl-ACP--UDP-N-acetylglucosamine O-acyltransferase [Planctomycetota bacterium]